MDNYPMADIEGKRCGIQACRGVWRRLKGTERLHPDQGTGTVKVVCTVCGYDTAAFWTIKKDGE